MEARKSIKRLLQEAQVSDNDLDQDMEMEKSRQICEQLVDKIYRTYCQSDMGGKIKERRMENYTQVFCLNNWWQVVFRIGKKQEESFEELRIEIHCRCFGFELPVKTHEGVMCYCSWIYESGSEREREDLDRETNL